MKIAILHGPRDLRIEDQPLNTSNLKLDEIWVKTEISALKIGTDRGNYEGAEQVPGAPGYPRWVGDSNLGVVKAVGSDVHRVKVGDHYYLTCRLSREDATARDIQDDDLIRLFLRAFYLRIGQSNVTRQK